MNKIASQVTGALTGALLLSVVSASLLAGSSSSAQARIDDGDGPGGGGGGGGAGCVIRKAGKCL